MAYVISDDCTACGTCIDECPVEAISEGDIYVIDPELCTDCGACADVCPVEAISPEKGLTQQSNERVVRDSGSPFLFVFREMY